MQLITGKTSFLPAYNATIVPAALISGWKIVEVYKNPFLADSPRDFWSRRWNLHFHNVMHRHVFAPICGKDKSVSKSRIVLGSFVVFLISGLMHEYLTFIMMEPDMYSGYAGWITVFFVLQGFASWLVPVHVGWIPTMAILAISSPLFVAPYRAVAIATQQM